MRVNKWPRRCVCYGGMKKNKHIFISRELSPESVFRKRLLAHNCTVEGQSLVAFHGQPFFSFPATEWIFFYSAKAAAYFQEGLQQSELPWPKNSKIATIGKGTARWLKNKGITVHFVGTGNPVETCQQFLQEAAGKKVLFPQALHSKKSIEKLAGNSIQAETLVVYVNRVKAAFDLRPADVLTFTSPMNAQAYFGRYSRTGEQQLVAIGQTTRLALEQMGLKVNEQAAEPSEDSLVEAVLRCLQ